MLNLLSKLSVSFVLLSLFTPTTISAPSTSSDLSAATFSTPLRILPLGDFITFGYINGSGSNGYREQLRKKLIASGASVDFVGTLTSGTMPNNQNEGHPGWTINQVRKRARPSTHPQAQHRAHPPRDERPQRRRNPRRALQQGPRAPGQCARRRAQETTKSRGVRCHHHPDHEPVEPEPIHGLQRCAAGGREGEDGRGIRCCSRRPEWCSCKRAVGLAAPVSCGAVRGWEMYC
ncbi:hypothetical protein PMIN04_002356 [Paraphaeosphaeria minitans]